MTDYIKREDAIKAVIADAKLKNLLTGNCENEKAIEGMVYEVLCPRAIPSADVVEVVQRNEDFNRVIDELLEIEAKNDIGYFTSTERRQFNSYVEDLLLMTIERAEE